MVKQRIQAAVFYLLLVVLLTYPVHGLSDVEITTQDGEPIEFLSDQPVNVVISYNTTEEAESFFLKLETQTQTYTSPEQAASDVASYTFSSVVLSEEFILNITEYRQGERIQDYVQTTTLQEDTDPPSIVDFYVGEDSTSNVYGPNSNVTVLLSDSGSGVSQETVRLGVVVTDNQVVTLDFTCRQEGQYLCTASLSGWTGQQLIRVQATDNARAGFVEEELNIRYDNQPPLFTENPYFINIYGQDEAETTTEIPRGQEITLEFYVDEQERPTAMVYLNGTATQASCSRDSQRENNDYRCYANIIAPNIVDEYVGEVTASDDAGNIVSTTFTTRVIDFNNEVEPNFWDVSADPGHSIDHENWAVNPVTLLVDLRLEERHNIGQEPMQINIHDCKLPQGSTNGEGGVVTVESNPIADLSTKFTLTLAQQGEAALDGDSTLLREGEINCSATIYTRLGNSVFLTPETKQFGITPEFITDLPPAREAIAAQIDQTLAEQEKFNKVYQGLRQTYGVVQRICGMGGVLDVASQSMALASGPLTSFPPTRAIGNGVQGASDGVGLANNKFLEAIEPLCAMTSCDIIDNQNYVNAFGLGMDGKLAGFRDTVLDMGATISGAEEPASILNPYKSIIVAAGTLCLPAIVHHLDVYQSIRCAEQECLQQVPDGITSVDTCTYSKRDSMCQFFAGSVYYAIPFTNVLDSVRQSVSTALSSPLSIIGIASVATCGPLGEIGVACRIARQATKIQEITGLIGEIEQSYGQIQNLFEQPGSYCDTIDSNIAYNDRTPFRAETGCQGPVGTYTGQGGEYISINGRTCKIRSSSIEGYQPTNQEGAATIVAKGTDSGYQVDCQNGVVNPVARQGAEQAAEACAIQYTDTIGQTEGGQDLLDSIQRGEALKQDIRGAITSLNTTYATQAQTQNNLYRQYQEGARSTVEIDGTVYYPPEIQGRSNDCISVVNVPSADTPPVFADTCGPVMVTFNARSVSSSDVPSAGQLMRMSEEDFNNLDPEIREYLESVHGDALESREDLEEIAEEIDLQEQRLDDLQEDQKELTKEQKRAKRRHMDEAYQDNLMESGKNFVKGMMHNAVVWGQLGATIDRFSGGAIPDVGGIGGAFDRANEWVNDIASTPQDAVSDLVCEQLGNTPPPDEEAIFSGGGQPIANLQAVRTRITQSGTERWAYRVDAAISQVVDTEAVIFLRRGVAQQELRSVSLNTAQALVGPEAIGEDFAEDYSEACIQFDKDLEDIFGEPTHTGGLSGNTLCTTIRTN